MRRLCRVCPRGRGRRRADTCASTAASGRRGLGRSGLHLPALLRPPPRATRGHHAGHALPGCLRRGVAAEPTDAWGRLPGGRGRMQGGGDAPRTRSPATPLAPANPAQRAEDGPVPPTPRPPECWLFPGCRACAPPPAAQPGVPGHTPFVPVVPCRPPCPPLQTSSSETSAVLNPNRLTRAKACTCYFHPRALFGDLKVVSSGSELSPLGVSSAAMRDTPWWAL